MDIKVPALGESVTEATLANWLEEARRGREAGRDPIVEIETDKVAVEVAAPAAGVHRRDARQGRRRRSPSARSSRRIDRRRAAAAGAAPKRRSRRHAAAPAPAAGPGARRARRARRTDKVAPSVGRIAAESGVDPADIPGTGKDGRATKGDALAYVASTPAPAAAPARAPQPAARAARTRRRAKSA